MFNGLHEQFYYRMCQWGIIKSTYEKVESNLTILELLINVIKYVKEFTITKGCREVNIVIYRIVIKLYTIVYIL